MKPLWKNVNFLLASITSVLFTGLGVVFALLLMRIVDAATGGDMGSLLFYIAIAVLIALLEFILGALYRFFTVRYAKGAMSFSKNKLFANTLRGANRQVEDNIAMYTTNTGLVYADYYQNHPLVVMLAAQFLLSVAGVIFIHWLLFFVVIGASLLPMFAPVFFQSRLGRAVEEYSKASKKYIDSVTDTMKGINEIKDFFAQPFFVKRHGRLNGTVEKARASHHIIHALLERASASLGSMSFLVIIGLGGYFVISDLITVGALIAVIQLVNGVVGPIGNLSNAFGKITANKELANKYLSEPEIATGASVPALSNIITMENVSFSYPQAKSPVLTDFSAQFIKGRSYAIVGESGCGKTTLVKLLAGLLPYDQGEIRYDGLNVKEAASDEYRAMVRYISQAAHLFALGVKDNVEMGHETGRYSAYLQSLGMGEVLSRSDVEFEEGKDLLSAGQQQRIILARSLNRLPQVLILDEPTANMDVETAMQALTVLIGIEGLTLIVITHTDNKELLGLFDEIIYMK